MILRVADIEIHDEVVEWRNFASAGRIVLLTTFRKQRDNEQIEVARARRVAEACARGES